MESSVLVYLFISVLMVAILLVMTAFLLYFVLVVFTGAPFVPAGRTHIRSMLEMANLNTGDKVMDLGSGDGRVVRAFARNGAIAGGCELNPFLVWWSRLVSRFTGLSGRTSFVRKNLFDVDCSSYDIVVMYAFPNMMHRLEQKLQRELKPGSKIISLAFPMPTWPESTKLDNVYLYEVGQQKLNHPNPA